jgi:8-oxo-dGTP pyrophosphatase MutT (NUDIX family)
MYEVYINEIPFRLVSLKNRPNFSAANQLVARYLGKVKFLYHYIDMMEKTSRYESITVYHDDIAQLIVDFESIFTIVEAAGGLVFNPSGESLLIFRRGFWDLPKGKIDHGESKMEAAIREVQEETGIQQLDIKAFLCETNHLYRDRQQRRCIKRTFWYEMHTTEKILTPQTEEDIEIAAWMKLDTFLVSQPKIYKNILKVIDAYQHR